jgi:hypothetical protein
MRGLDQQVKPEPFESRKHPITVRMSESDLGKIKGLARRLGVHDSDVVRFAVKAMITELAPLHDPEARGQKLLPVFVEFGHTLFRHFELDAVRLDAIINEGVSAERRVAIDDLELLAEESVKRILPAARETESHGKGAGESLKDYLFDKYIHRGRQR